jgi:monoamine oxidase
VLEGRSRSGGRIWTRSDSRASVPIELGAEFIHGEAPLTRALLAEAGLTSCDVSGEHWRASHGTVRRTNFWKQIDRTFARIDPKAPDEPFAAFLARRPGGRALQQARATARGFVQGFHAADVREISTRAIASEEGEAASEEAARMARVIGGHGQLVSWLERGLHGAIMFNSTASALEWREGQVNIAIHRPSGRSLRLRARAAVLTVPLGVLKAAQASGGLVVTPEPSALRAAKQLLSVGTATRLTVLFRGDPWESIPALNRPQARARFAFMHMATGPFNVWWTAYPLEVPVLLAWCGGPASATLTRQTRAHLLDLAITSLAANVGLSRRRLSNMVEAMWIHDWNGDPFARGAYSYPRVGGENAGTALARPVRHTLFFAGEATAAAGERATVEGAIASGQRAARQVLRALG